ncbi:uncharacterized protein LOC133322796 [Musca vetustissima]|uniref:uncharacterized protein LOC133322796 n=1 Tax=Musca vetustissima TaxID=27455 RepID=UPI002AB68487|nr:uncharacterized protein LOC133322796 [Musca vetustissima]
MANMFVFIIIILIVNACIAGTIPATPENITVTFLTPTTVRVSWQTMIDLNAHPVEKYIVTYKPTDDSYRVMQDVAGNSEAIILDRLTPGTQYSIVVSAVWLGKKYRSRQVIFRTLGKLMYANRASGIWLYVYLPPKPYAQQDSGGGDIGSGGIVGSSNSIGGSSVNRGSSNGNGSGSAYNEDGVTSTATNSLSHGTHRELPTIRGVEIGIVLIVLMVWAGAIALFFNRWGKIRMLLPYQPDYKHEQLKVPGTGVCSGGVCNGQHSHQNLHHDLFVKCLPRCEGCGIFDRCFQYPRRELERDCGCQFALLHKVADGYRRVASVDSQAMAVSSYSPQEPETEDDREGGVGATSTAASDREGEDNRLLEREPRHRSMPTMNQSRQAKAGGDYHHHYHRLRQKKFATQRSILKNSQDNTTTPNEDQELLEAKKQLILRKRRLFSHYRQYEQWRRRQFSYDPCYMRVLPPPSPICTIDYNTHTTNANAFRRRRQYRRQYSCAERSREDSRDSRDSSHHAKYHSMAASDTIRTTNTSTLNLATNPSTLDRFSEEHSASISERITRSRINSAIFVSSEGRGFDSIEFLRRHGSQSVLCRKAKSAENITDNGRKKSFAENRQWHTDDNNDAQNDNGIEMHDCSRSVENHPVVALKNNVEKLLAATSVLNHSATVTTSNKVVGSISIETPPSHIREAEQQQHVIIPAPPTAAAQPPPPLSAANTLSFNSASHDSADTVEELVSIPIDPMPGHTVQVTVPVPVTIPIPPAPAPLPAPPTAIIVHNNNGSISNNNSTVVSRPRVLVRQRSSTASPVLSSTHSSPKALKMKSITPKLNNLPMVSVSGPSPSDEKPPPSDCL